MMEFLSVPYAEKEEAKKRGARWFAPAKRWYMRDGWRRFPYVKVEDKWLISPAENKALNEKYGLATVDPEDVEWMLRCSFAIHFFVPELRDSHFGPRVYGGYRGYLYVHDMPRCCDHFKMGDAIKKMLKSHEGCDAILSGLKEFRKERADRGLEPWLDGDFYASYMGGLGSFENPYEHMVAIIEAYSRWF